MKTFLKIYIPANVLRARAADVNGDGKITPSDALMIYKRWIKVTSHFSISDWLFDNNITVTVNGATVIQDIHAICAGDIDGSYPK